MFPRQLLSSHFWSIQQRFEFYVNILEQRLRYNLRVFRFLQAKLSTIKEQKDYDRLKHILGLLGSGLHPSPEEIIAVRDIFEKAPYDLYSMPRSHLVTETCGTFENGMYFYVFFLETFMWIARHTQRMAQTDAADRTCIHCPSHGSGDTSRRWCTQFTSRIFVDGMSFTRP